MYKNKDKQREAERERKRRMRQGVTKGVTALGDGGERSGFLKGATYPDIIDKLTNPVWRGRFISTMYGLGDTNLSTVCDYLECTR